MLSWRLIDTGILTAAENIAWDQALLSALTNNSVPILRFLRFSPPCVLIGRHQSPSQEARLDFVNSNNWVLNRRITGGGAIYFEPSQIGWEIFATKNEQWAKCGFEKLYRNISNGAIAGLKKLGITAKYRPRNDIEVDGRKISGTGGTSDGDAFMFQGTLLVKNCAEDMLRSLRVPAEKLGRHGLESIKERVVFLDELLSPLPDTIEIKAALVEGFEEVFNTKIIPDRPNRNEYNIYNKLLPYHKSDKWIYKIDRPENNKGTIIGISRNKGVLRTAIQVDAQKKRISSVQFWGDFFIEPQRAIYDIEALLKHQPINIKSISNIITDYLNKSKTKIIGLNYDNFTEAIESAIIKLPLLKQGFSFDEINKLFFVNIDPNEWQNFPFSHFLFPYCAKLTGCKYRHRYDCPICGGCTVGNGYEMAIKSELEPFTITSFQSLVRAHRRLRNKGSLGYIGSCCEEFFVKHFRTFKNSGLKIILIKIDSATCYDLSQAKAAYRGDFESQTELDMNLIEKVLSKWNKNIK